MAVTPQDMQSAPRPCEGCHLTCAGLECWVETGVIGDELVKNALVEVLNGETHQELMDP